MARHVPSGMHKRRAAMADEYNNDIDLKAISDADLNADGDANGDADRNAEAAVNVPKHNCSICNYSTDRKWAMIAHKESRRHLVREAKLEIYGDADADVTEVHHCSICNYSTKRKGDMIHHEKSKGHLEKEAKLNGNTAVIVYKYNCSICDFSTNMNGNMTTHMLSKAHKEAMARVEAKGDADGDTNMISQAA